jgi:hypothetical protein
MENTGAFQELLGEIKLLRADLAWLKKNGDATSAAIVDMDKRLRNVESTQSAFVAAQGAMTASAKPPISWPVIVTIIVAIVVAAASLLDRIYVSQ